MSHVLEIIVHEESDRIFALIENERQAPEVDLEVVRILAPMDHSAADDLLAGIFRADRVHVW